MNTTCLQVTSKQAFSWPNTRLPNYQQTGRNASWKHHLWQSRFHQLQWLSQSGLRFANNINGGMQFVDWVKWSGVECNRNDLVSYLSEGSISLELSGKKPLLVPVWNLSLQANSLDKGLLSIWRSGGIWRLVGLQPCVII